MKQICKYCYYLLTNNFSSLSLNGELAGSGTFDPAVANGFTQCCLEKISFNG